MSLEGNLRVRTDGRKEESAEFVNIALKGKEFDWIIYKEQIELQVDAQRGEWVSDWRWLWWGRDYIIQVGCIIIIMASTILPKGVWGIFYTDDDNSDGGKYIKHKEDKLYCWTERVKQGGQTDVWGQVRDDCGGKEGATALKERGITLFKVLRMEF